MRKLIIILFFIWNVVYSQQYFPDYTQGVVIENGIGYASREVVPAVASFNLTTLDTIKTFPFDDLYDSSPLIIRRYDGAKLCVGHEINLNQTVAYYVDSAWGKKAFTINNHNGSYFYGYGYYRQPNDSIICYFSSTDSLSAFYLDDGTSAWNCASDGGMTIAVEQDSGYIYYQSTSRIYKFNAVTGDTLDSAVISAPGGFFQGNTMLVKDPYRIVTYWHNATPYNSAIRTHNASLTGMQSVTGLPCGKKATLCYGDGRIYIGGGDAWQWDFYRDSTNWKWVRAYDITTMNKLWELDLTAYAYKSIMNIIYANGYIIAETQGDTSDYVIFKINPLNGEIINTYTKSGWASSCGVMALSGGKVYSGDLNTDSVIITTIGNGEVNDWDVFGNSQLNQMRATPSSLQYIPVPFSDVQTLNTDLYYHNDGFGNSLIYSIPFSPVKYNPVLYLSSTNSQKNIVSTKLLEWEDLSAFNNDALQADDTKAPIDSDGEEFDGTDDYMSCGNDAELNLNTDNGVTIFIKFKLDATTNRTFFIKGTQNLGLAANYDYTFAVATVGTDKYIWRFSDGVAWVGTLISGSDANTNENVICLSWDGSTDADAMKMYINDAAAETATAVANLNTTSTTHTLYIGGQHSTNLYMMDGSIYELVIYDYQLNDTERLRVKTYLQGL